MQSILMLDVAPLRLGFLTHLHIGDDAAHSYMLALELFVFGRAIVAGFRTDLPTRQSFLRNRCEPAAHLLFNVHDCRPDDLNRQCEASDQSAATHRIRSLKHGEVIGVEDDHCPSP